MKCLLSLFFVLLFLRAYNVKANDVSDISTSKEGYLLEVDLTNFDNNPENIRLIFARDGKLIVDGKYFKNKSFYQISRDFDLKLPVDENGVVREQVGNLLKIRIPFNPNLAEEQKEELFRQQLLVDENKLKSAAMSDIKEDDTGYRIDIDLSMFGNNLQNIDVNFTETDVEVLELDANGQVIFRKNYTLYRQFDKENAVKLVKDNIATIYIPFPKKEVEGEEKLDNTQELLELHNQYSKILEAGVRYNLKAELGDKKIDVMVYQMADFSRLEAQNDSFVILGMATEGDSVQIIKYESETNEANLLKEADGDIAFLLPSKYQYLEKDLSSFEKRDEAEEYALPCTIYTKKDIKGVRRVCINQDTGIMLLNEKEGIFKLEVRDIEFGEISNEMFKIPPEAKLKDFSI